VQQMIYSKIFHQILKFPSEKIFLIFFYNKNFNIFENSVIGVKLALVLWYLLLHSLPKTYQVRTSVAVGI
jgi:hypothetical protein